MSKQKTLQRYILKINSTRLKKAKWNLSITLPQARENEELISIGDSQMIRWIDELNGVHDADSLAREIREDIRNVKKEANSIQNRRKIRKLYEELDTIQFIPDYLSLVIDRVRDYRRACEGFKINGIKYVRLVGTSGGVKNSTIVFVSERLAPELRRRITNGRDESVNLVPAKLEAYRALTCSGSTPVSMPKGILVVNDCETEFFEDVINLSFGEGEEPIMAEGKNQKIVLNESDGYGMILPSLAKRWSEELDLDYVCGGFNTRFSWEKGMVFAFDFLDFAENIAKKNIVKDAWGNDVDITTVEMVLTTSMLKLWNCYDSMDDYLRNCEENHYTFGVTKTAPAELENERTTNYQYLQCFDLSDDQIEELIQPTINEIKDILSNDYRKAILFMSGMHLSDTNVEHAFPFSKALMADSRIYHDSFIKQKLMQTIKKRINDAKIGVIKVHGNYSIICGDPYSLCQSIFGIEVTGLLKAGEIYNRYWGDSGSESVVCFRAPMTSINNVVGMRIAKRDDVRYWYRYIPTCTMFNSWDSSAAALNGMD